MEPKTIEGELRELCDQIAEVREQLADLMHIRRTLWLQCVDAGLGYAFIRNCCDISDIRIKQEIRRAREERTEKKGVA